MLICIFRDTRKFIFLQLNFLKTHITVDAALSKTLNNIMKLIIAREVALLYTAQKKVLGKKIFKDTVCFHCLKCKLYTFTYLYTNPKIILFLT